MRTVKNTHTKYELNLTFLPEDTVFEIFGAFYICFTFGLHQKELELCTQYRQYTNQYANDPTLHSPYL